MICTPHQIYIRVIKSRMMRWSGHVARRKEKRDTCGVFVGKPEGNGALGRHKCKSEDNIQIALQEIKWGRGLDCSGSG
jgi:hypothetical protein